MTGLFKQNIMTIGVDFYLKNVIIDKKKVILQIWDFAGEKQFRSLASSYINGASGAIFMYDITLIASLMNLNDWLDACVIDSKRLEEEIPIILVGGKLDLQDKRTIVCDMAFDVAKKSKLYGSIECSSKTGENVEEIFETLTRVMMKKAGLI